MYTLNCKGRLLIVNNPLVMGIINVTPDSFYQGSRKGGVEEILKTAATMIEEGADILDIGGQSTRPGSERISVDEELKRVLPAIENILKNFPKAVISVDTYNNIVAKKAIDAGALMINDISAGSFDKEMMSVVADEKVPYVCMHIKGEPASMQKDPEYENVTLEVLDYLSKRVDECVRAGIKDIIIDPGFGFGKTINHNFQLLRELNSLSILERPILIGISRKSTIYKTLGVSPEEALNGSTVLNTIALMNGASILRVHDVRAAKETVTLFNNYEQAGK